MKKKFNLAILLAISAYFVMRFTMLFAMTDKNHKFIHNMKALDLLLPNADVALTILFFFIFYNFFKNNSIMKYVSVTLMVFFIPFTILVAFLYVSMNSDDEQSSHFLNGDELLVVIDEIKGLHPDNGDPRQIYMYEKTGLFIYKKIGQSQVELTAEDLTKVSDIEVGAEELSVVINEKRIFLEMDD